MHRAAESGSSKACEVILNLRLDAVYDTDKKVLYVIYNDQHYKHLEILPSYINTVNLIFLIFLSVILH